MGGGYFELCPYLQWSRCSSGVAGGKEFYKIRNTLKKALENDRMKFESDRP